MSNSSEATPGCPSTQQKEVCESTAIIVCRGDSVLEDDEYISSLRDVGFKEVRHLPLLEFEFREDTQTRLSVILQEDHFDGIIFTSPRTVYAVEKSLRDQPSLFQKWNDKMVFAVGPKTCLEVKQQLGLEVTITDEEKMGKSKILAESILPFFQDKTGNLLMPCSSSAHDDLPDILSSHGVTVIRVSVYDTRPASDAVERLGSLLKELTSFKTVLIVFFSPSNVKAVAHLLQEHPNRHFIAIGPTTESALRDMSIPVLCVSPKPNPVSLSKTILAKILESNTTTDP